MENLTINQLAPATVVLLRAWVRDGAATRSVLQSLSENAAVSVNIFCERRGAAAHGAIHRLADGACNGDQAAGDSRSNLQMRVIKVIKRDFG